MCNVVKGSVVAGLVHTGTAYVSGAMHRYQLAHVLPAFRVNHGDMCLKLGGHIYKTIIVLWWYILGYCYIIKE